MPAAMPRWYRDDALLFIDGTRAIDADTLPDDPLLRAC